MTELNSTGSTNSNYSLEEKAFLDSINDSSYNIELSTDSMTLPPPPPAENYKIIDDNMGKDLFKSIVEGAENIDHERPSHWTELNSDDIFDMFHTFINYDEPNLDLSKFDFRTHTADWYKEKYPHFPDNFYEILEEASRVKIDDKRDNGLKKIDKVTTLKFD
tara:strand:+ start:909 stop:1394 length:486 start_codon:yes stop_codon:yes gene_type:complete